jgi:site-specific recombinase XerD
MQGAEQKILRSKAKGTYECYSSHFRHFSEFMQRHGVSPVPASAALVVLYFEYRAQQGLAASTLKAASAAIQWVHKLSGFDSPTSDFICSSYLEGLRRSSSPRICKTIAARTDTLEALRLAAESSGKLNERRTLLGAILSYCGALRFDECKKLKFKHITVTDTQIALYLSMSKTDQHKHGHTVYLAASGGPLCPKANFERFRDLLPASMRAPDVYVFASQSTGQPIKSDSARGLIRAMLASQQYPRARQFTMHSFRIGCVTTLVEAGVDSIDVRQLGRWATNSSFDRYYRPTGQHLTKLTTALGV